MVMNRAIPEAIIDAPMSGESVTGIAIEAAGGVLWRDAAGRHGSGCFQVLIVHRPSRRDWSLPKGKLRRGETHVECAVREVREETGMRCHLGDELSETRYHDRKGRLKRVRYWSMSVVEGAFVPNPEVDRIRWVHIARVGDLLTYQRDLIVVAGLHLASS